MKTALLIVCLHATMAAQTALDTRKASVRALLEKKDFAAALDQAKSLNRESPDDTTGYQLLAAAHLGMGNYAGAEDALQWMLNLRIGRADAEGWLLIARFREVTGDLEGAIDAVNSAYGRLTPGLDRERAALLAHAARLQYLSGRLENADRMLADSLAITPDYAASLDTLARVRIAQGKRPEALEVLCKLASATEDPRYLYQLGEAGGGSAAYASFERAARERVSSCDNANRELVLYYAGPGARPAEALEIARREAARRQDIHTLDALAVALEANGKSGEAREVIKRVLATGTRDREILSHAARMGVKPQ